MGDQRLRCASDGLLDERAHPQDGVLDLLLLEVERFALGQAQRRLRMTSGRLE